MKLTIEKRFEFAVDTDKERKRIEKAFKKDLETKQKLNELMDLIEAEKWKEAWKELTGKWWQGRDKEQECPRLEFAGLLIPSSNNIDHWMSYIDLVMMFVDYPESYRVVGKTR